MRRLLAVLLLAISANATTVVTGHISNLDTTTPGTTSWVRFWLRGCRGNQPRITGTGGIAPQVAGSSFYVDVPANASGNVSGTIYSTRDAAGTGNGDIECGGSYTAVWYGMVIYNNGIPGPEIPVHAKNGGTLDISNVTPITTNPVVTAPTGDSTYARKDGGNQPFTGAISAPSAAVGSIAPFLSGRFTAACTAAELASLSGCSTVNAVVNSQANPTFNAFWVYGKNGVDDVIGVSNIGLNVNGIGMDDAPDATFGASPNGILVDSADTATGFGNWTFPFHATFPFQNNGPNFGGLHAGQLAPEIYVASRGGTSYQRGGTLWLIQPDTNSRFATLGTPAAPTVSAGGTGGTIAAGHYRVMIGALNDVGESVSSAASSDTVVSSGQILTITITKLANARAYWVYAAYNAGSDPGTTRSSYHQQWAQSATGKMPGLMYIDPDGSGAGTITAYISVALNNGTQSPSYGIQDTPLSVDRSAYYYLRGSPLCNQCLDPSQDAFNLNANGKLTLGSTAGNLIGSVNIPPVNGSSAGTLQLFGGNAANNPTLASSGGFITVQGVNMGFSSLNTGEAGNPGGAANTDVLFADSTAHRWKMNNNNAGAKTVAALESDTFTSPTISLLTNGTGIQIFNTSTTCTTGASVGATCTTSAISLPVAEADTSYRVSCTGKGVTNVPVVIATTNSSASQFTITVAALTAAAASFSSYDCVAGHN